MSETNMATNEDALDEALKALGLRRFEVPGPKSNGFVNVFQVLQDQCLKRLADIADEYAVPGGVGFGFAEHREFNAFAQRTSKDVICFYSSSVRVMWSLFNAIMTIREIFPWIDDIDRLGEQSAPPAKGDLFFIRPPEKEVAEPDPIRWRLAAALFDVAMDFTLMHEVAHLWNGHVELFHQKNGQRPYQEMHLIEGLELSEAQALEFDADSFAIQKVFARVYRENPFKDFSTGLLKDHSLPADGEHTASWYFTWFAIYALFKSYDEACAAADLPRRAQPPAALRLACLLSTVTAVCSRQGWSQLSMELWAAHATSAGLEAEGAICRMRGTGLNSQAFNLAWSGIAFDQIEKYLQTWDRLGPQLAALKRGPMAAKTSATAVS
ncbi:MAG TPA: hypothetical protein VEQ35_04850 [Beijerinckia sp.]|nr:hypothetical protein [Beijerinckia sp.]